MGITFKYTVLALVRERSIVIWVMLFPIILSTLFHFMFANLEDEAFRLDPVPVAVVYDDHLALGDPFDQVIEALSGDEGLLDAHPVESETAARELFESGEVVGFYQLDGDGDVHLVVSPVADTTSMEAVARTVLADVADSYLQMRAAYEGVAAANPAAFADPSLIAGPSERGSYAREVSVTHGEPTQTVRYFYALLGFAAVMAAMVGLAAIVRVQPNLSALAARRAAAGLSRARTLAATIAASWIVSLAALLVGLAWMRLALGVDFGGREGWCVAGIGAASLMSVALGCLVGAVPKLPEGAKSGILTGLTCGLSLFAGLYGQPAIALADQVARDAPWAAALNPVKRVTDMFYSLYVYPDLSPFFEAAGSVLVFAVVFALVAALLMRRQRYASL